jgi:ribosomal protein S18 acetylase RimI-like enzyme
MEIEIQRASFTRARTYRRLRERCIGTQTKGLARFTASMLLNDFRCVLGLDALETFIGYQGRVPVGYFTIRKTLDSMKLESIGVIPEYRKAGIGTRMMQTAIGYAAARGSHKLYLTVDAGNEPAISLYRRQGMTCSQTSGSILTMTLELREEDA